MSTSLPRRLLGPIVGLALLAAAWLAARHELSSLRPEDVLAVLRELRPGQWGAALALTAASFVALAAGEVLATRHLGVRLSPARAAAGGLLGWAVSNTLGPAWLSGGAVRLRVYGRWGVPARDVARIVAFDLLGFWAGFAVLGGAALALDPPAPLEPWGRAVGVCALGVAGAVFLFSARGGSVTVAGRTLQLPPVRTLLGQIAASVADGLAATGALAVLLPHGAGLPFTELVGLFALSNLMGVLSGLPGGVGTFEAMLVALAPAEVSPADLLAAVLAWRVIYGLVPLALAGATLGGLELRALRVSRPPRWLVGPAVAALSFVSGLAVLVSSLTALDPSLGAFDRLEASRSAGAAIGLGLVFVARGLWLRTREAFGALVLLLVGGIGLALLRGGPVEAAALAGALALVWTARSWFSRPAALAVDVLTPLGAAAVCGSVVVLAVLVAGAVAPDPVEVSRLVRALAPWAAAGAVTVLGLGLRPAFASLPPATEEDIADALRIAAEAGTSVGWMAATGDKALLFDAERAAFLMVGVVGDAWVALGGPIGRPSAFPELLWAFRERAHAAGARIALYQIPPSVVPLCADLGLRTYKVGEDAHVPLRGFALDGRSWRNQRQLLRRAEREGTTIEVVPGAELGPLLPELRAVSDAWLLQKGAREKGFSLGRFDEAWLSRTPVAVARQEGKVVAFANLLVADGELSVDLMRHLPDAPNGTMELLFLWLVVWGSERGFQRFGLGMAPLSGLPEHATAPAWARLGHAVYERGDAFYRFRGLRAFKDKFHPTWEPRYLAVQGRLGLPRTLGALVRLVSGGFRQTVLPALARAHSGGREG